MTQQTDIKAPWSLHFDRDGTEDVAIICDADGNDLARSRHFWLPEGDDPIPQTLAAMQVMVAAPKVLEALIAASDWINVQIGKPRTEIQAKMQQTLAEATGIVATEPRQPIVIEVRGGVVQDVLNMPPGIEYEIRDYDNPEEGDDAGRVA